MTTSLSIRNPDPLKTGREQTLSIEFETQDDSPLFLIVPLGEGAGALMTREEFDKARVTVVPADPKRGKADARKTGQDVGPGDVGTITITRRKPSQPETFCVLVESFNTGDRAGSVDLRVTDVDDKELAKTTVEVIDAKPQIVSFTSSRYTGLKGTSVTLSWEIEPSGDVRLRMADEVIDVKPGSRQARVEIDRNDVRFRLDAMSGGTVTDTSYVTIHPYNKTELRTYAGPGEDLGVDDLGCGEILGLYAHGNRLHAVVRDRKEDKTASLWVTRQGFDRAHWEPRTSDRDGRKQIRIPVGAASRPGAVFDGKLYFMGGSSYDANRPGNDVGYFHFEANTWVDGEADGDEAWPREMRPRMGHGLVASPDGQSLWVLGGYNGDGGAMNDIWVYDKDARKWTPQAAPPWEPRCLFGVAFQGPRLWISGGFDSPGGYPTYDDIRYLDTRSKTNTWQKIDSPLVQAPDNRKKQYCGSALAGLDTEVYAFAAYRRVEGRDDNSVIKIAYSNREWGTTPLTGISSDWVTSRGLPSLDCYRLDATVFGGCLFVRRLARSRKKDKTIHYLVLV